MNKKAILYVGIYAVVAYGAWYLYNNTKKAYAAIILKAGMAGGGEAALLAFDKAYLKPWAMAVKAKAASFTYNGVNYNTNGGKAIK
jgi:hypothetical protein